MSQRNIQIILSMMAQELIDFLDLLEYVKHKVSLTHNVDLKKR